jgi:hypothetical protein
LTHLWCPCFSIFFSKSAKPAPFLDKLTVFGAIHVLVAFPEYAIPHTVTIRPGLTVDVECGVPRPPSAIPSIPMYSNVFQSPHIPVSVWNVKNHYSMETSKIFLYQIRHAVQVPIKGLRSQVIAKDLLMESQNQSAT